MPWASGDEVYGADGKLRAGLRRRGVGYVPAVAKNHRVATGIGPRRAIDLAVRPDLAGSKDPPGAAPRATGTYDWVLIETGPDDGDRDEHGGHHRLLLRRNITTSELAFYRTWSPRPAPLSSLVAVAVAVRRWSVEESFQPVRPRPCPGCGSTICCPR